VQTLTEDEEASVQLIAATHSPLVLASVEPFFDVDQDRLFALELVDGRGGAAPGMNLCKTRQSSLCFAYRFVRVSRRCVNVHENETIIQAVRCAIQVHGFISRNG